MAMALVAWLLFGCVRLYGLLRQLKFLPTNFRVIFVKIYATAVVAVMAQRAHAATYTQLSAYIYICMFVVMLLIAVVLVNCFIDASRLQTNAYKQSHINIEFMRTPLVRSPCRSGFGSSDLI